MNIGSSIFVIAVGALLAFAVRTDLGWLDVQIAGVVLILTGIAMLSVVLLNRHRRRSTVKQERVYEQGRPETMTETRVYRDDESRDL